jgi:hypothetical protein
MKMHGNGLHLFRKLLLIWVVAYTASAWLGADQLNTMLVAPAYVPPGPLSWITHALARAPEAWRDLAAFAAAALLVLVALRDLVRTPKWWSGGMIWLLYVNLMHTAWLAGSGGQQLVANMLFWMAVMAVAGGGALAVGSFWIMRMQLVLAYVATALHKLMGTHWPSGDALGIVVTDPDFGPAWLAAYPVAARLISWSVLAFQLSAPIMLPWRTLRRSWMLFGLCFHLATALWMDLPDMAAAFVLCYALWLDDDEAEALLGLPRRALHRSNASR